MENRKFILLLFTAALVYKIIFICIVPDTTEDAYLYIRSAEKAAIHGSWSSYNFGKREHYIFTFMLYTATEIIRNGMLAGKLLALIFSSGTLYLVFQIGIKYFNRRTALGAIIILSFIALGHLAFALSVLSDSMFTFASTLILFLYLEKRSIYLISLLAAISFWIRVETGFLCLCFGIFLILEKRWKDIIRYGLITSSAMVLRILYIKGSTLSSVKGTLSVRFGRASGLYHFLNIVGQSVENMFRQISGESLLLMYLFILLFISSLIIIIFDKKRKLPSSSHVPRIIIFLLVNILGICIMRYKNIHPMSYRHFTYLAPFFAILISVSFDTVLEALERKFSLKIHNAIFVVLTFFMIITVAFTHKKSYGFHFKEGFIWKQMHFTDSQKAVNKWLKKNLNPGDGVILSLPSDNYYFKNTSENKTYGWDVKNRYNYSFYRENNIRYVVWTNLQTGTNDISALSREQDYLFFKYRFTPEEKSGWYGWKSVIYEINQHFNQDDYLACDYGDGFIMSMSPDNRVMSGKSNLCIYSPLSRRVRVSFKAECIRQNTVIQIKSENKIIHEEIISDIETNSEYFKELSFLVEIDERMNSINLKQIQKQLNGGESHHAIKISKIKIREAIPGEIDFIYRKGWFQPEGWGRWIGTHAIGDIYCKSQCTVKMSFKVRSHKIDRRLEIFLNGKQIEETKVSKEVDFKKNILAKDFNLHLKKGRNIIEFKSVSKKVKSTKKDQRALCFALVDFKIELLK
jgi:hypothetical protein